MMLFGILKPNTLFMEQDLTSNHDEILHLVPEDRDAENPFYITVDLETCDRFYWTSPQGVQYSVFKEDVISDDSTFRFVGG